MLDVKFSVAIHMLIMISEGPKDLTSEQIGRSVNKNASYIRKILALLKKQNIICSQQGKVGIQLAVPKAELTLWQIYKAIQGTDTLYIWDIHTNANDQCIVGQFIRPTLEDLLAECNKLVREKLEQTSLADVIHRMRNHIEQYDPEIIKNIIIK